MKDCPLLTGVHFHEYQLRGELLARCCWLERGFETADLTILVMTAFWEQSIQR
uniref:Uncharacterized protein n=1 Tax=Anguilla anguilla TaxID=7936 RepID=A0A0E9S2A7_ANGAN